MDAGMTGGDAKVFKRTQGLLASVAKKLIYLGPSGYCDQSLETASFCCSPSAALADGLSTAPAATRMPNTVRILGKSGGSGAILVAADGRIVQDLVGTSSGSAERLEKYPTWPGR